MKTRQIALAGLVAGLFATSSTVVAQSNTTQSPVTGPSSPNTQQSPPDGRKAGQDSRAQGASPQSSTNQATTAGNQGGQQAGAPVAVLVLLPAKEATDPNMAKGCWVRFHSDENFRGQSLTLVGPVDMPNMDAPGAVWQNWESAVVGPRATVTTYDNENFSDRTSTLNAGQRLADLGDNKLGWFEEVKSARVACRGS